MRHSEYRIIKKTISAGLGCLWRTDDLQDPYFYSLCEVFFEEEKIIFVEEIIKNQKLNKLKQITKQMLDAFDKDILDN